MIICAYAHILQVYSYIVNTSLNMEGWSGQLYNKQTGETRFNGKVSEINNTLVWYRKGVSMSLVLRFRSEVDSSKHVAIRSLGINMSELYNLNVNVRTCIIRDLKII